MPACPNCDGDNSDLASFCQFCGSALRERTPVDQRKVVTIVFTDVTGSTSLGEGLDPETLRSVMTRYFDAMREVIEHHGGTVEKFIGDAVMAVFGVPRVHEDDALRAVRAAAEMQDALATLNLGLDRDRGLTIRTRTGVNTGEVMAGDAASREGFVAGDTVNVAARLEQAAEPGEVLLGATTYTLVRDAVTAERIDPLDLKGKAEPVPAYRLLEIRADAAGRERHLDAPMVGRGRQLRAMRDALEAVETDRTSFLFTVLGSPGVGKTRLVEEFLSGAEGASVHRGRCLSYGEGITFWPVDQILRSIAGVHELEPGLDVRAAIRIVLEGAEEPDAIEARLAALMGLSSEPVAREDGFWAVRRLFEHAAARVPLVLLLDDIHWAEPTLLDLVEHVADWSRTAPILLLCTARPELVDIRPNWGGGKANASSTLLEPLTSAESEELIVNLVGPGVPDGVRERISEAAEGNPLFVEEMLGMLIDDGRIAPEGEGWSAAEDLSSLAVPASIHALITARLDRLGPEERTVVERGSVEGNLFHVGGVAALAPDVAGVPQRLMALVRKEFIRPDKADFAGEDAFRFRHLLIRDSAYESMPKRVRAELHERFADWLVARSVETASGMDAIVAHHLDQAHRYLTELGGDDARRLELAELAGTRYVDAGWAAFGRGDARAARSLLDRSRELLMDGTPTSARARLYLGRALISSGEFDKAEDELHRAEQAARSIGERAIELDAGVALIELADRVAIDLERDWFVGRSAELERAFLDIGDRAGAARAILAAVNWLSREEGVEAARRALELARAAGDHALEVYAQVWVANISYWAGTPASQAERFARSILQRPVPDRVVESVVRGVLGGLLGMQGRFVEGREEIDRCRAMAVSLGERGIAPGVFTGGYLEIFAGDLDAADRRFREGFDLYLQVGEKNRFSTLAAHLAELAARRGDFEEADRMIQIAEAAATATDEDTHSVAALARSLIALGRGNADEAMLQGELAIALIEGRGVLWQEGRMLDVLADARLAAGDLPGARVALTTALERFEHKEILPFVERTRRKLDELSDA